jgi:integrase/recombinase XerD
LDKTRNGGAKMLASQAVYYNLEYHRSNSRQNSIKGFEFVLGKFNEQFKDRMISTISVDDVMSFLIKLTFDRKQTTKSHRFAVLSAFYNFTISTLTPDLRNPCDNAAIRKIFRRPNLPPPRLIEKDRINEIIFRTTYPRDRLMLELMGRAGMRVSEVLNLRPCDMYGRKLILQNPKSGRLGEVVYISNKIQQNLANYISKNGIKSDDMIFPFSYSKARRIVKDAGEMVSIKLRPHDLRRYAATHASRAGVPLEIVSKVILRHANLKTTQRYLGTISDVEALRWVENIIG